MRSPLARLTRVRLPGDVHRTESAPPRWLLLSRRYGSRAIPVEHDLERRTVLGFRIAIKVFRTPGGNAGRTLPTAAAGIGSAGPAGARPSFVLVHGIGVSSRYFHPVAAFLAGHGTVYAIDLPGYGESPRVRRDVTLDDHAAVVAEVIRMHGLVDPVVVGHSMGTQIVTRLAVDHPEVADRIVLIAPTLPPRTRGVVRAALALGVDTLREPLLANAVVLGDYFLRCGMRYYLRQLPHLIDDAVEERAPRIRARTLVIVGDRDAVVDRPFAQELAARIPRGTYRVARGPHVVMYTDPLGVARAIVEHARAR
ncbi:alpha/beta fold hydrolase [Clavibacter sepedonicus]|uniref:Hydrolase n=1 Tax=Clavibacter sepedonicus TaxID=31964 RepID=B0RDE3_CLASE|nr:MULTISPECIES: alpha/beta hydrolase [Clavibacter]MBD5381849.1 alpha/beta hydrolase [Clavibacter sp.]OQJ47550.1 alpha/beta hydrolase [Clavibacter sepedonicus]OQJ53106.1 alpha/beta hydrolase [Clavibacter sepedonicus]UUK64261.1 alpha/beta hydrolase [Clavibacter sepedonicus]CAQ01899.1 putative hydrolase [Clavibacter sepedonicus]